jgi:hypothetical protein
MRTPAPARAAPRPAHALRDDALDGALALALRLAGGADPYASPLDLGDVDLPPVTGGTAEEQARLRSVAPLYLAGELESTRLLPAVEVLAGLYAQGAVPGDVGAAAPLLLRFRHRARERLTAGERDALFGRLFGKPYGPAAAGHGGEGGRNDEFDGLMVDLCDALGQMAPPAPHGPGFQGEVRVHAAASPLAASLLLRAGGMTDYAAREVLEAIRDALEIVKVRELQAAFRQQGAWATVQEVSRRYLGQATDLVSRVARGRSGTTVLAWLADVLPAVGDTTATLVAAGSPVTDAALAWMQASLALRAAGQPRRRTAA